MLELILEIGGALLATLILVAVIYQNRKVMPKKAWIFSALVVVALVATSIVYWDNLAYAGSKVWAFGAQALGAGMALVPAWATFWECLSVGLAVGAFSVAVIIASGNKLPKELLPLISRIPVICWFGAVFSALMAAGPYLMESPGFIKLVAALIVLMAVGPCVKVIPEYKAGVIVLGKKPVRSSGSGWVFLFRPFGFNFEDIVRVYSIEETAINDITIVVELGGPEAAATEKEYLKFEVMLRYEPDANHYVQYQNIKKEKREQILIDYVEAFCTDAFKSVLDTAEAYELIEEKEQDILAMFQGSGRFPGVQKGLGLRIIDVQLDDAEIPEKTREANIERANRVKDAELEVEIQKATNRKDVLQLGKIRKEVGKLLKDNPGMSPEKALERVQVSLKIIPESKQTFDIGAGLQHTLGTVLSAVLNKKSGADEDSKKDSIGF